MNTKKFFVVNPSLFNFPSSFINYIPKVSDKITFNEWLTNIDEEYFPKPVNSPK